MAAILGMPFDKVSQISQDAAQGEVCQPANINSPEQIVISGHAGAVGRAIKLATERGAKKAVSLPVSAPFHCSLMQPAQDRLAADLGALGFHDPSCPVVCNVDAALVDSANASREALIRQVTGAVRWEPSVRLLINQGAGLLIEVGPGKVLWGLMRQIDRSKTCSTVGDEASLQKTLEQIAALAA
jgi:[acyl-carrier-protein] S-malonyltransferase